MPVDIRTEDAVVLALDRQRRVLWALAVALGLLAVVQGGAMLLPLLGSQAQPQAEPSKAPAKDRTVSATREKGSIARVNLGYGIVLNKETSLQRDRITLHDSAMPVDFAKPADVTIEYNSDDRRYEYRGTVALKTKETITAIEYRVLTFDVFGEHLRTLSGTEVRDVAAGQEVNLKPAWAIYGDGEASKFLSSVAFVARVRLADGRVVESDQKGLLDEVRKLSRTVSPDDLAPAKTPAR